MAKQVVACKAVIVRDGKILLLRESSEHSSNTKAGQYQFPGGRIDPGEPFADGLRREAKEETGLNVTIGNPFYVGEWFPTVRDEQLHIVGIFFLCDAPANEVIISDEHDDYQWVGADMISELPVMSPDKSVAEQYFNTH